MTAFARNTLADLEGFRPPRLRDFVRRRVAGGAARIRRGLFDSQGVGDLFGARRGKRGKRALRMKIPRRPHQILILVFPPAAMTPGRTAGCRAEESGCDAGLSGFRRTAASSQKPTGHDDNENANVGQEETKRFTRHGKFVS